MDAALKLLKVAAAELEASPSQGFRELAIDAKVAAEDLLTALTRYENGHRNGKW